MVEIASWIVHLRIAENLLGWIPDLDESLFAIGNIAPDSGIPDEKWENFDPPVHVTHFENINSEDYRAGDLAFFRQYLDPNHFELSDDPQRYSFLLGYFFHLTTDNLWAIHIAKPTLIRYKEQFAADPQFIWEVKKDWYGLDFLYVRENLNSLFWRVFIHCTYDQNYLDFLPIEAVRQRITYIQDLYQQTGTAIDQRISRPYVYLSKQAMDDFVTDASRDIYFIYQHIWEKSLPLQVRDSALELTR